jgi:hypothetical protein
MTKICNLMIVPYNQLVRMVILNDSNNNFEDFTDGTVSMECVLVGHLDEKLFSIKLLNSLLLYTNLKKRALTRLLQK